MSVVKNTHAPAMLVEVCFVDTQSDINLYNKLGEERIPDAIVKAIVEEIISILSVSK